MVRWTKAFWLPAAALFSGPAHAQLEQTRLIPIDIDVVDAIECRLDAPTYNDFARSLESAAEKGAARRKWQKIKGSNPFMMEYRLPKPIVVADAPPTTHIALTSTAILAVLDVPDPAPIAKAEAIENAAGTDSLIAGMVEDGVMTRDQAARLPRSKKFLGEKILSDNAEHDEGLQATFRTRIARVISTVDSHPGQTLYGCSYSITMDEDAEAR